MPLKLFFANFFLYLSDYMLIAMLLCLLSLDALSKTEVIKVNHPLSDNDNRYSYTFDLLEEIIAVTQDDFGAAEIKISRIVTSRNRTLKMLIKAVDIDVMAEAPKPDWDAALLPVRIPIRKGLQGHRIFLIKKEDQQRLREVETLSDLTALPTGSGQQWSTRAVLEKAGFNVRTGNNYDGLFNMLSTGRFTTFSRGVNEAYKEAQIFQKKRPNIIVDDHVLLYIPLPTYFYVTPKKPQLAKRIEVGLTRLFDSGRFDQFFLAHHCDDLIASQMHKRIMFSIENPNLDNQEFSENSQHWLNPMQDFSEMCQEHLSTH
jgi:hypothetical protein